MNRILAKWLFSGSWYCCEILKVPSQYNFCHITFSVHFIISLLQPWYKVSVECIIVIFLIKKIYFPLSSSKLSQFDKHIFFCSQGQVICIKHTVQGNFTQQLSLLPDCFFTSRTSENCLLKSCYAPPDRWSAVIETKFSSTITRMANVLLTYSLVYSL